MDAPRIDELGRLIGDSSRARMLAALLDGRAWTGRELANVAHVTASTASEHLKRLVEGALLAVVPQGRHHYYRIASPGVAQALETLMVVAPRPANRSTSATKIDPDLRRARTCYDHLAGELGVGLARALVENGALVLSQDSAELTKTGARLFADLGVEDSNDRRALCRPCLDWSERRFHLAGRAAAALTHSAFERDWIRRKEATRAVAVTKAGVSALRATFGLEWSA